MNGNRVVTLIPGDGIGPEVTEAARRVVEASGASITWKRAELTEEICTRSWKNHGTPLPPEVAEAIRETRVVLKGPVTTPIGGGYPSVNVRIRKEFGLYANRRPCRTMDGVCNGVPGVDIVVFRENTEDLYIGYEFDVGADARIAHKIITREATERIAHAAFKFAQLKGRKKITIGHKANILKKTDGFFLKVCRDVGKQYLGVECSDMVADNLAMQLVRKPTEFDVLLLPNLYGDIISDLCAGLIGGLGLAPGANIGDDCAMFEAVHGSAPGHTGKNDVNPTAVILAACLMLEHTGETSGAQKIRAAVEKVIREGKVVTYDIKGTKEGAAQTLEMADAIIAAIQ